MIKYKHKNIKILDTFICLKVLRRRYTQNKYILNFFNYKMPTVNLNNTIYINKHKHINIFSIVQQILYTLHMYKRINIILKCRSRVPKFTKSNNNINRIDYQYIKQFIYKYQTYYKNNVKKKSIITEKIA